jgi:hypothetical protein
MRSRRRAQNIQAEALPARPNDGSRAHVAAHGPRVRGQRTARAGTHLSAVAQSAPPYWPAGRDAIILAAADDSVVLVPHSNADLLVPAVVEALGDQVRGVVFVDAALPGGGHHSPSEFLRRLATVDGLLPPC